LRGITRSGGELGDGLPSTVELHLVVESFVLEAEIRQLRIEGIAPSFAVW
jgi:hypothetical protein